MAEMRRGMCSHAASRTRLHPSREAPSQRTGALSSSQILSQSRSLVRLVSFPSSSPSKLPPLAHPSVFNGSSDDAQSFLNSVQLYINGRSTEFLNEDNKIYFAVSYMKEGRAKAWIDNLLQTGEIVHHFTTWPEFVKGFKREFFDPIDDQVARREIRLVRQGSGTVAEFITAFEKWQHKTKYDDLTLREIFEQGLIMPLRKSISTIQYQPNTLVEWKDAARKQYMQMTRFNESVKSVKYSEPKPGVQGLNTVSPAVVEKKTSTGTVYGGNGQPMDIALFKKNGLCFNCGNWGHIGKECPHKKPIQTRQLDIS